MITHRFLDDLENLENNQVFCDRKIQGKNKLLIVGTFNPSYESFPVSSNNAPWFYGRTSRNKFWHYLPLALNSESLHPKFGGDSNAVKWKCFCNDKKIVIIDLIKSIDSTIRLTNQKDMELEKRINSTLNNVTFFDVKKAFKNVTFDIVAYSLAWSQERILPNIVKIRNKINNALITEKCIKNADQIKYCKTPWRNDAFESWQKSLKGL